MNMGTSYNKISHIVATGPWLCRVASPVQASSMSMAGNCFPLLEEGQSTGEHRHENEDIIDEHSRNSLKHSYQKDIFLSKIYL